MKSWIELELLLDVHQSQAIGEWNVTKSTLIFTTDWHIFQRNWIQFYLDWKLFISRMFLLFMMGERDGKNVIWWKDEAFRSHLDSCLMFFWGVILCNFHNSKSFLVLVLSSSSLLFTNYLIFRRLVHSLESTMQKSNIQRQFSAIFFYLPPLQHVSGNGENCGKNVFLFKNNKRNDTIFIFRRSFAAPSEPRAAVSLRNRGKFTKKNISEQQLK